MKSRLIICSLVFTLLANTMQAQKGKAGTTLDGWAICNGNNGTPDLRGRFVVGAIAGVKSTGAPVLSDNVDPNQLTDGTNNPNYKMGKDNDQGTNAPKGKWQHKLSVDEMPSHNHGITTDGANSGAGANRNISALGSSTTSEAKNGSVQTLPHTNLPPYYALAFIMRIN